MTVEIMPIRSREEWLRWRQRDITASDLAAIVGANRYSSAGRVWAEKKGYVEAGVEASHMMARGQWMEPAIAAMLAERHPDWTIQPARVYLRDAALRIGCTPDLVVVDPARPGFGVVDMKCHAARVFRRDWLPPADDEADDEEGYDEASVRAPLAYQLQVLMQARMAGASWGMLAPLALGEFRADLHEVPVDVGQDAAWANALAWVAAFWSAFDAGRMPYEPSEMDKETLAAIWPREAEAAAAPLDLSGNAGLIAALDERERLKALIKEAEERCGAIEAATMAAMRDAGLAQAGRWRLKWSTEDRKEYTVHFEAVSRRVLRISAPKPKKGKA